jgi:GntR family transcriptional regulator/MocR family aminotransferase
VRAIFTNFEQAIMAKRVTSVPATGITLDRGDAAPLHRQLYQQLRTAILAGQLVAATRLPSTRTLARELGVSRTTALLAYEQLRDEGYLDGRIGAGTTVAPLPRQAPAQERPLARPALSMRGTAMAGAAWPGDDRNDRPHAFQLGMPDIEHFPWRLWAQALSRRARAGVAALPGERDPAGYLPLRAAIAAHLGMARGVRCTPQQVIVVAGAQAAFDLASRLLLDPGDPVWFEDPGYPGARAALVGAGARPVPVPVDAYGLDIDAGHRLQPTARAVYVTPSHQFPLGVTMSVTRRLALLAWAARAGAVVLEDDYDSEFRYVGQPPPALQGLDDSGRVVYLGTFSKALFPELRVGYLVVPGGLVDAFTAACRFTGGQVPLLEQAALADFMTAGHFGRHVRRMRAMYAQRGAALIRAVQQYAGDLLEVRSAHAGLHLVGWLPAGVDDTAAAKRAAAAGIEAHALSSFAVQPVERGALLLGYAPVGEAEIAQGARLLAGALRPLRRESLRGPGGARPQGILDSAEN